MSIRFQYPNKLKVSSHSRRWMGTMSMSRGLPRYLERDLCSDSCVTNRPISEIRSEQPRKNPERIRSLIDWVSHLMTPEYMWCVSSHVDVGDVALILPCLWLNVLLTCTLACSASGISDREVDESEARSRHLSTVSTVTKQHRRSCDVLRTHPRTKIRKNSKDKKNGYDARLLGRKCR